MRQTCTRRGVQTGARTNGSNTRHIDFLLCRHHLLTSPSFPMLLQNPSPSATPRLAQRVAHHLRSGARKRANLGTQSGIAGLSRSLQVYSCTPVGRRGNISAKMALNVEVTGCIMAALVVAGIIRAAYTMVATQVRRVSCMAFFGRVYLACRPADNTRRNSSS